MGTENKDKKQLSKNPAMFCCFCEQNTEDLEKKGVTCRRVESAISNTVLTVCKECISENDLAFKGEEHIPHEHKIHKIHSLKSLTPLDIYTMLDKSVMGQNSAKRIISSAVATHLKRIDNSDIEKSNILILGPTGSGKTEIARTLAKALSVPVVITDATTLTAHGFVGEDVESILLQLLHASGNDLKKAETGIVFIDEFDKLAKSFNDGNINTGSVQQSLLKMIEGGKVKLPKPESSRKKGDQEYIFMDTSKILFICAGAFAELEETLSEKTTIGISSSLVQIEKTLKEISVEELKKFGMIGEILGRLPIICHTEKLTEKDLLRILIQPQNSLVKQFTALMKTYGIVLELHESFLKKVANEAATLGTGARGLRAIMEKQLQEVKFEGPSRDCNYILVKDSKVQYLNKAFEPVSPVTKINK